MESRGRRITIGIESAVGGGSIALFRDQAEIDGMVGKKGISRAEDILPNIDKLLRRNRLRREDIGGIVAATGPGSFTGIKIGIATALGLADGLDCPAVGMSSLDAMTYAVETDGLVFAALPVGRDFVAVQCLKKISGRADPISSPELLTETQLTHKLRNMASSVALHAGLIEHLSSINAASVVVAGPNIASLLVQGYLCGSGDKDIVPLFIDRKPPAPVA